MIGAALDFALGGERLVGRGVTTYSGLAWVTQQRADATLWLGFWLA
jgi:hypothetical protein